MKLIELVKYLESDEELLNFYNANKFSAETEAILVYMTNSLEIESDIFFFTIEETEDNLRFEKEGRKYLQLFPLDFGVQYYSYFEEVFLTEKYTDIQKAKRLLEYVINDA